MATWQAVVGNNTYNLNDRAPFDVVTVTGVGISPMRRITQRGPLQHGETDIGYRLDSRAINLVLAFAPQTLIASDAARDLLTLIFGPRQSTPVSLRCTRDDGSVRQIDCRAVGMVDMPITPEDRVGVLQRVAVQLQAADPNWYDPTVGGVTAFGMTGATAIPLAVPLTLPAVTTVNSTLQINYTGTFDEFPVIQITGPLTNPLIENLTTGDKLQLAYTINAGSTVVIDLRYGQKTAILNGTTNILYALSSDSALAAFRFTSVLDTGDGANVIRVTGTSATSATRVSITYYDRYLSL